MTCCSQSELFLDVASELLSQGRSVRFRAEGDSMYPTIRKGEAIVVEPVPAAGLRKGDVALYRTERGITAHRVVASGKTRFKMRGDAMASPNEPVDIQQILGRVVAVEREGRSIDLTSSGARIRHRIRAWTSSLKRLARKLR